MYGQKWLCGFALTGLILAGAACEDETLDGSDPTSSGPTSGPGGGGTAGNATTMSGGNGGQGAGGGQGGAAGGSGGASPYEVCADPPAAYPMGPYGTDVGDVFEPLEVNGWTNPNPDQRIDGEPFGAYTLSDLRVDHPATFVLFHLSGMF